MTPTLVGTLRAASRRYMQLLEARPMLVKMSSAGAIASAGDGAALTGAAGSGSLADDGGARTGKFMVPMMRWPAACSAIRSWRAVPSTLVVRVDRFSGSAAALGSGSDICGPLPL